MSNGTDNINIQYDSRKLLTQTQILNDTLDKKVLSIREKLEFLKTSVSWITSKDIMDTCFVLNYGYEAPLPWPQVSICDSVTRISYFIRTIQVRMKLDDETNGMDVPISCSMVIIAGK